MLTNIRALYAYRGKVLHRAGGTYPVYNLRPARTQIYVRGVTYGGVPSRYTTTYCITLYKVLFAVFYPAVCGALYVVRAYSGRCCLESYMYMVITYTFTR